LTVFVVRDALDELVVDRNTREMGRVDGIELELRPNGPPRLSSIVMGPVALGSRIHPTIGRWIAAFESALGLSEGRPVRIEFSRIRRRERHLETDVTVSATAANTVERWVRTWVRWIPGSR
jgi:hypothetical protein